MDNNRDSRSDSGEEDGAIKQQMSEVESQANLHAQQTLPSGQLPMTAQSAPHSLANEADPAVTMRGVVGLGPMPVGGHESHDNQSLQSWLAMQQQQQQQFGAQLNSIILSGQQQPQPMAPQQSQLLWQPTQQQFGTQQPIMFPQQPQVQMPQSQFVNAATADVLRQNVDPAAAAAATGLQMQHNPFSLPTTQPLLSQQDEQTLAAYNQQLALVQSGGAPDALNMLNIMQPEQQKSMSAATLASGQLQFFPQGQPPDVALTLQQLLGLQAGFVGLHAVAPGANHALAASFQFPMHTAGLLQPQMPTSRGTTGQNETSAARAAANSVSNGSESGKKPPANDKEKNKGRQQESFPQKLYRMLIELEASGDDDIISFSADGDCFEVHQPTVFAEVIIPRFFRHNKLTSFHRQCGLYGFKRISQGPDAGAFCHPLFRKGQPELCNHIKRVK